MSGIPGAAARSTSNIDASGRRARDGSRILAAGEGGWTRIWEAATGRALLEVRLHKGTIFTARFNPGESAVVTAGLDGTACVSDAQTGAMLIPPLKHQFAVRFAEFTPEGKSIVTASEDGSARIWEAATGLQSTDPMLHNAPVQFARMDSGGNHFLTACIDGTVTMWDLRAILPTEESAPAWFPDFAEAFCGFRLNAREIAEPVPAAALEATRRRIRELPETDPLTQWARGLLLEP